MLIYVVDLNHRLVTMNDEFAGCFVNTAAPARVGHPIPFHALPAPCALWAEHNERVLDSANPVYCFQERFPAGSQDELVACQSYKLPLEQDGQVVGVLNCSVPVTDQTVALPVASQYQHMASSASVLDAILNYFPGHVYWHDVDGVLLGLNARQRDVLGCQTKSEAVGRPMTDFISQEEATQLLETAKTIAHARETIQTEETTTFLSEQRCFRSYKGPLLDVAGEFAGIFGLSVDITSEKQAEKARADFVASMSHDIRTPMTGMIGMVHQMIARAKATQQSVYASVASEQSGETAMQLIDACCAEWQADGDVLLKSTQQLLNFCNDIIEKVKSDCITDVLTTAPVNLRALLGKQFDLLRPVAQGKGLVLQVEIAAEVPELVESVATYIERVALNLLTNALKFTQSGSVTLSIKVGERPNEPAGLCMTVTDTGIGIPADRLPLIFEDFFQVTPAYQTQEAGSGLGLYLVQRAVTGLSGEIEVDSVLGEGSTFTVRWPIGVQSIEALEAGQAFLKTTAEPVAAVSSPAMSNPHDDDLSHGQWPVSRVLLVEDHPAAAKAVSFFLESLQAQVDIKADGTTAVAAAAKTHYDLILLDLGLPDIAGEEVARQIRMGPEHAHKTIPIVALTGHGDSQIHQQACFQAGMQAVLAKPASLDDLKAILRAYVFSGSSAAAGSR
jgi:PAS domain S-box-containing protein